MSSPEFGQAGYQAGDVAPKYQRWLRFCNAVLRVSSVEQFSRLLAYARDVEPGRDFDVQPFEDFKPDTSVQVYPKRTLRLPQLRKTDITPLPEADYDAAVASLSDCTLSAFQLRQDLIGKIRSAKPERCDLKQPGKHRATLDNPETGHPLVRFLTPDKALQDELADACVQVIERHWPAGAAAPEPEPEPEAEPHVGRPMPTEFESGQDWAADVIASGEHTPEQLLARMDQNDPDEFDRGIMAFISMSEASEPSKPTLAVDNDSGLDFL